MSAIDKQQSLDLVLNGCRVGVGPHALAGSHQALKAQHRSVDGAVSGKDEDVVQESAKGAAAEWGNHGNLQYMVSNNETMHHHRQKKGAQGKQKKEKRGMRHTQK